MFDCDYRIRVWTEFAWSDAAELRWDPPGAWVGDEDRDELESVYASEWLCAVEI